MIHKTTATDVLSVAEMNALQRSNPETMFEVVDNNYGLYNLYTRLDQAPFNDVRVRRAMSLAIDRPGMVKDILEGSASILAPIPWNELFDTKPGLDKLRYYRYDPTTARQLLKDAGYANGLKFKVNYYAYTELARYIAVALDNLKAVDVNLELTPMDNTSFNAALRTRKYDTATFGVVFSGNSLDGAVYDSMNSKGQANYAGINDPEVDRLTAAQRVEMDQAKRKDIIRQIFALEADQVWRIPFPRVKRINYFSPKLHNYLYSLPMNNAQHLANNLDYIWLEP